jgi:hypothetical protein
MHGRKVTKAQVCSVITKPDSVRIEHGVKIYQKTMGKQALEVVGEIKKNKIIVVTAYWL